MSRKIVEGVSHGTRSAYTNDGCRCRPCTQANTEYMKEYIKRPGKKKDMIENASRWREENPKKYRESQRAYRERMR